MMENWSERMIQTLQLNGMSESTQFAYVRAVRQLSDFYQKTPDVITEEELRQYFLHKKNVSLWSVKSMRICYYGVRFFYVHVLQLDWHLFNILRTPVEHRLPTVLSEEEVRKILSFVHISHYRAYLTTVYTCGLRLQEGLRLKVSDIDGSRRMLHVHCGKGAKDRYVPLPDSTLEILRRYWKTHRHPELLFPAVGRDHKPSPDTRSTMTPSCIRWFFRLAKQKAGITKKGVCVHTLRHSYATHLLEAGSTFVPFSNISGIQILQPQWFTFT